MSTSAGVTLAVRHPMLAMWGAAVASFAAADWLLDQRHDGSTFSECVRYLVGPSPTRQALFVAGVYGGATWFAGHILRPLYQEETCAP